MLTRRQFLGEAAAVTSAVIATGGASAFAAQRRKLNVLFIPVDDLRPQLGCYGVPQMHTPNIDALAKRGTVFNRAYCQQAVCSPSRSSLMTGCRPDTTKVYDLVTHFRTALPDVVTLSQQFKNNGYHAQSVGKIYHPGYDDKPSWSAASLNPRGPHYGDPKIVQRNQEERKRRIAAGEKDPNVKGPSWESADVGDSDLPDGKIADLTIKLMNQHKDRPFFLACGFHKPHLPFVAPKKYFDLYPKDQIRLASNPRAPKDVPELALTNSGELRQYTDIPKKNAPIPDEKALELIRAYYASTSYMDAQVGRVLAELDRLGLRENTVIVLWGDHGWQLGEHGLWNKHTNFEVATRSPLIVSAPNQKQRGTKCDALVEFVDIYPTLCALCDVPLPGHLEGTSFAPLLDQPNRQWKKAAFSQYPRNKHMGYSMRTERWRYTEWRQANDVAARELYDHQSDPDENVNLANQSEHKATIAALAGQLKAGWRQAAPS